MAELSMWLDGYNDIYSDFDARALPRRRISEDFMHELEAAYRRREEHTDCLTLQVPADARIEADEKLITARLNSHFTIEYELSRALLKRKTNKNILFFCSSLLIMVANILISTRESTPGNISSLRILLEPAGWFFFWNSLEYFIYERQSDLHKKNFWYKLAGWKILFRPY
jgi:hypothetical protein